MSILNLFVHLGSRPFARNVLSVYEANKIFHLESIFCVQLFTFVALQANHHNINPYLSIIIKTPLYSPHLFPYPFHHGCTCPRCRPHLSPLWIQSRCPPYWNSSHSHCRYCEARVLEEQTDTNSPVSCILGNVYA